MSSRIKLGLYLAFTVGVCIFGYLSFKTYRELMNETPDTTTAAPVDVPALGTKPDSATSNSYSRLMTWGGGLFIMIVGLGLLLGHDVANFFGNRALHALFNDEGESVKDPEYDRAEQVWADGHYLDSIRLMRDYLLKNPREQHVAIRIAEIYEKDLQNYLAAALEYEEILKQKLAAERWGWSAIHLCNLYLKLNQPDKAVELLRRIDAEYPQTAAAEKARKRLAMIEAGNAEASEEEQGQEKSPS